MLLQRRINGAQITPSLWMGVYYAMEHYGWIDSWVMPFALSLGRGFFYLSVGDGVCALSSFLFVVCLFHASGHGGMDGWMEGYGKWGVRGRSMSKMEGASYGFLWIAFDLRGRDRLA